MDEFRPLLEQMLAMPGGFESGALRKKYQPVGHIAHGWMKRAVRGTAGLLALHDAGLDGEGAPLARSVIEHVVALRWLVAEGDQINGPLRTNHHYETGKFVDALRHSTKTVLDETEYEAVLASAVHDDHSRDHFAAFTNRVRFHGRVEDMTMYQQLVMESHATYQSGIVYYDAKSQTLLQTSRTDYSWTEFGACLAYRALMAFSSIFLAPPWRKELAVIYQKLIELDPNLVGALDD